MALKYILTIGFFLDVFAILPLEIGASGWSTEQERWKYVALLRINRIVKLWKVGLVCMSNVYNF